MMKNKFLSAITKPEAIIVIGSLISTITISGLIAIAGSSIIGTFWSWFTLAFVAQFIGFVIINSLLIQKQRNFLQQTEVQALEQFSKFTIRLLCAYCNQPNEAQILLNEKNMFMCSSCNQTNGIHMQFTATTITTPIESIKLPLPNSEPLHIKV